MCQASEAFPRESSTLAKSLKQRTVTYINEIEKKKVVVVCCVVVLTAVFDRWFMYFDIIVH